MPRETKDSFPGKTCLYDSHKILPGAVFIVKDDNVLIVIGGDSYYRDENEETRSVISRWARRKVASQFREEYMDGRQSFIFSWDEKHRMIHEEAMRHFLDPGKRGSKFEYTPSRPSPKPIEPKAPKPLPKPIPPVIPQQRLSKPKTPVITFASRNVRQESSLVESDTEILIQNDEEVIYGATSSVTSGRSAGVETETVLLETKVRYGEISYNDEDVLQRKDGWRPSERQASIVMGDLKPYAVRTVKFFRTGGHPAVKFSYDKRTLPRPAIRGYNGMSRSRKCLFMCHSCLIFCWGMFKECMIICFLYLVRCLGFLWGWCSDWFRGS